MTQSTPASMTEHSPLSEAMLHEVSDEDIQNYITVCHKILDQRKLEREKVAKENIKQLAKDAGIKVAFVEEKPQRRRTKKV